MEKWFERKSDVRYVIMATFAGGTFGHLSGDGEFGFKLGSGINSGSILYSNRIEKWICYLILEAK